MTHPLAANITNPQSDSVATVILCFALTIVGLITAACTCTLLPLRKNTCSVVRNHQHDVFLQAPLERWSWLEHDKGPGVEWRAEAAAIYALISLEMSDILTTSNS